jgi:hypothetical protein
LKLIAWRLKKRRTDISEVFRPRPASIRRTIVSRVRSGSVAISPNSQAACGSKGERLLPPRGRGLTLPVSPFSATHRIADAIPTWNRSAA